MARPGRVSPTAESLAAAVAASLPDAPIVVALSGGADSAALAWAVVASGRPARAVSVDHGLAGSAALMEAARSIARTLGLDHRVVATRSRSDSETDLREARLAALESSLGPDEVIVTGHTKDDQAETVLGNLLRGTGTAGLGGIPRARGVWVRPMLDVTRETARAVASEAGLPFVDDPQNSDPEIRRNRLRSETIPALAAAYNPSLPDALARLGDAAATDHAVLDRRAAAVPVRAASDGIVVQAASLQVLPEAVAARVAARALRTVGAVVDSDAIRAVLAAAYGSRTTVAPGVDVVREGPWVVLASGAPVVPDPVVLRPGGDVSWGSWTLDASGRPAVGGALVATDDVLVVRAPRPGDRIALPDGSKSVADALSEAGVPQRSRPGWPLLEADGRIVWIPGVRAAPVGKGRRITVRALRRRS